MHLKSGVRLFVLIQVSSAISALSACNPGPPIALPNSTKLSPRISSDSVGNTTEPKEDSLPTKKSNPAASSENGTAQATIGSNTNQPVGRPPMTQQNGGSNTNQPVGGPPMTQQNGGSNTNQPVGGPPMTQQNVGNATKSQAGSSSSAAQTTNNGSSNVVNPAAPTGPGELRVSAVNLPAKMKSNEEVSITFTVTNSGGPVQGIFGTVRVRAQVFFQDVEENVDIETAEMIPSGTSVKSFKFVVPAIPVSTAANTCIRAFRDKARQNSIGPEVCRDVQIN